MRSVARTANGSCRGLQPPFEKGHPVPGQLLCATTTAVFFCSWPRCHSAAAGCTYIAGCGYRAPDRRGGCRIGEVWTSPRRESPRLPRRSQRPGGTSTAKADAVNKSCWRIAAPLGRPLSRRPLGGATECISAANLATVPAPSRLLQGRARNKGPPMLASPHQAA